MESGAPSLRATDEGDRGGDRPVAPPADIRPPSAPWIRLEAAEPPGGFLSFYYSDPRSRIPVRAVTRFAGKRFDNKSDPNIETLTYGLFSTCEAMMRASVVSRRSPYLVFVTTVGTRRCISGYYRIGWWTPGPSMAAYTTPTGRRPDIMLAADEGRFILPTVPLSEAAAELNDPSLNGWFRTFKGLSPNQADRLVRAIQDRPDASAEYISEVHRLERMNLRFSGFRYPGWRRVEAFDWEGARRYLPSEDDHGPATAPPYVDKTGIKYWKCLACGGRVDNLAPLKWCPWCNRLGTLVGKSR